jgi:hypothetical protein
MNKPAREQTEQYYVAYQRSAVVGLLFGMVAAGLFLAALFRLMSPGLARVTALIIIALFIVTLLSVHFITLRGRLWHPRAPEAQRVLRDEWTRKNWNRACRSGFYVVMWAQVPLAYFVNGLPPEPDVPALAALTMALGVTAFFGSYLFHSRQQGAG